MRKVDIIAIAAVALFAFPILYVVVLFATGMMRVEFGYKQDDPEEREIRVEEIRHSARRDSLAAENTKIFEAVRREREELAREQERLIEQHARIGMLQGEIERQREELVRERTQLENRLAQVPEAEDARYRRLARIYEAMKPGEAAAILETLPDAQAAAIIGRMGDNRQKGRIMALLTKEKAARLNRLLR
jgi:flagellar motility protein MotE (MotC chaperone)